MAAARKRSALTPYRYQANKAKAPNKNPRSLADLRGLVPEIAPDNTEFPTTSLYPVNRKRAKADAKVWDARAAAMRADVLARRGR